MKEKIEQYIKSKGYTWSYDSIMFAYDQYKKGYYVSHTAKDIIKNVIESNSKEISQLRCIQNFTSLDGSLIFSEGCTYPIENNVIVSRGYNLHWNDKLLMHFRFN